MKLPRSFFLLFISAFFFITITPQAQEPYNHWALHYFKQSLDFLVIGDYPNVILSCNEVLRRDPNSSVTYTIRARAYFEMGDFDKAIADCTQAIRHDRANISAYSIRGNSYARKDDITRAVADWNNVLQFHPDNNEAQQNIEFAKSRLP